MWAVAGYVTSVVGTRAYLSPVAHEGGEDPAVSRQDAGPPPRAVGQTDRLAVPWDRREAARHRGANRFLHCLCAGLRQAIRYHAFRGAVAQDDCPGGGFSLQTGRSDGKIPGPPRSSNLGYSQRRDVVHEQDGRGYSYTPFSEESPQAARQSEVHRCR